MNVPNSRTSNDIASVTGGRVNGITGKNFMTSSFLIVPCCWHLCNGRVVNQICPGLGCNPWKSHAIFDDIFIGVANTLANGIVLCKGIKDKIWYSWLLETSQSWLNILAAFTAFFHKLGKQLETLWYISLWLYTW